MNGDFVNSHFVELKNRILKNSPLTGRNEREVDGLFVPEIFIPAVMAWVTCF